MGRYIHHGEAKTTSPIKKNTTRRSRDRSMPRSYWRGSFSNVHASRTSVTKTLSITDAYTYEHWRDEIDALNACRNVANVPRLLSASADVEHARYVIRMSRCIGQPLDYLYDFHCVVFDVALAFDVLHQLLRIVRDIHATGMTHYDIKIENILYDTDTRTVSLVDFGFCKAGPLRSFHGTENYAAPEITRGVFPAGSPLCDIYSIGVCAYFILCMVHGHYTTKCQLNPLLLHSWHATALTTPTLAFLARTAEQMMRPSIQRPTAAALLASFDAHVL